MPILVEIVQGNYRDKASHGLLWDALALITELVLRGGEEGTTGITKSAECVKRLEGVHALLCRQEAASAKAAPAKPMATRNAPRAAPVTKGRPAAAPGKGGVPGKTGAPSAKAAVELAPKCIGALKHVLAELTK
jgi:hypothetical protein